MAHQVQHCIIGDGLEATLLAVALLRLKQTVALVQTTQPVVEGHAVAVTEPIPALAPLYEVAHQQWPQRAGYKPVQWRVQGMNAFQLQGGIIQTMTALGDAIKELRSLSGIYCQVSSNADLLLTAIDGKITGATAGDVRINAEKVILANSVDAYTLAKTLGARIPLRPSRCHNVGMVFNEQITIPPIAVKLPQGHVYLFSDGPQHVQALYTGTMDQKQSTWRLEPDPDAVQMVERLVAALLPKVTWRGHDQVRVWLNAVSPDGLPIVGPIEGVSGLWVCSGLDEHAAFLAPALAANLADALCDRPYNQVLNDMMPARIQRAQVAHDQASEITRGTERLVAASEVQGGNERFVQPEGVDIQRGESRFTQPEGVDIQRGEEHLVQPEGVDIQRGESRLTQPEGVNIQRGGEKFVDTSSHIQRGESRLVPGGGQITRGEQRLPEAQPQATAKPAAANPSAADLPPLPPKAQPQTAQAQAPSLSATTKPAAANPSAADLPPLPPKAQAQAAQVQAQQSASPAPAAAAQPAIPHENPDLRPEVTRGGDHVVNAPTVTKGEEHMVEAAQVTRGEKKMVEAPKVTKGEERFVDTSSTVVRNTAQLVMEEGPKVKHGAVRMDDGPTVVTRGPAEPKVKMSSLKRGTHSDKKVTLGSLKKDAK